MHGDWEGLLCVRLWLLGRGCQGNGQGRQEGGDKTKVIEGLGGGKLIHPVLDSLLPKSGKDKMATVLMIKARVLYHKKVSTYSRGSFVSHSKPRTPIMKNKRQKRTTKKMNEMPHTQPWSVCLLSAILLELWEPDAGLQKGAIQMMLMR